MRKEQKLFFGGHGLFFFFIIFAQLIWLFDSIRLGEEIFWIEMIDYIVYLFALLPFLWLLIVLHHVFAEYEKWKRKQMKFTSLYYVALVLNGVCILGSIASIFYIIYDIQALIAIIILILTFILHNISYLLHGVLMSDGIPKKSMYHLTFLTLSYLFLLYPTSYMVTYPGLTMNMDRYVQIVSADGRSMDGSKGETEMREGVIGVLVFERPAFPVDWLYSNLFPMMEFKKRKVTDPPLDQQLEYVRELKVDANREAKELVKKLVQMDVPLEVKYRSFLLHEGGPSHGAMLALTLLNQIYPGLTNGNLVAGTGTINENGEIGLIGGIMQKAFSVNRIGVDVFFVPSKQLAEAKQGAPNLNIVPVNHIQDIISWLEKNPKK